MERALIGITHWQNRMQREHDGADQQFLANRQIHREK
jgi:hypothetical protein